MSIRFLNKMSSYLFIFNPCISLQLICPCAHGCVLTFISFYFILFFVFACSKSLIVFILSLDPFLANLLRFCAPWKCQWRVFGSDVSRGQVWNGTIGHIWVNQWWSHLADDVPSLCPLGELQTMWFSVVFRGYRMEMLARDVSSTGNKCWE